jgi:hypothetical protein
LRNEILFGQQGREGMESVDVGECGRVSIVTLMLKQILDRNLRDPRKRNVMKNRVLTVQIRVRKMLTTLFFEADRIRAEEGAHGKPDMELEGDMPTLLSIALGGSPVRAVLRRKLRLRLRRFRGWWYGLRFLLLMQLGQPPVYLRWLMERERKPNGCTGETE